MDTSIEENDVDNASSSSKEQWMLNPSLYINGYLSISHLVFTSIGIPLNLFVMGIIIALKRLHLQRTFTWLGVGFSNLLVFALHLAELQAVHWPSSSADKLCALLKDLPYFSLILNHFLSFLERHLCIKHSNWCRRHITSCWIVLAAQFGSFVVFFVIFKGRHLSNSFPLQWQMGSADLAFGLYLALPTFVLCLTTQVALWAISRWAYPSAKDNHIALRQFGGNAQDPQWMEENEGSSPFVHIGCERVSRLDVEAARNLTASGLIIVIFFIPYVASLIHLAGCLAEEATSPDRAAQLFYYARELISIPCSSISPISFVIQSQDIRSALRDRRLRWFLRDRQCPTVIFAGDDDPVVSIPPTFGDDDNQHVTSL